MLQVAQPPHGGVAEHVRVIGSALGGEGIEVEAALSPDSRAIAPLRDADVEIHEIPFVPAIRAPGRDLTATRALVGLLRRRPYDVVHAHGAKAGVLARLAGALTRTPVVYTAHGWAFNEFEFRHPRPSAIHRGTVVWAERVLAPLAAFTVCVSAFEEQAASARRLPGAGRRRVIHHGVRMRDDAVADEQLLAWRGDGVLIGAVSVFRPEKGLGFLVDAAAAVRRENAGVRIALVGEGDGRRDLEHRIAAAGVGDTVRTFAYGGSVEPHLLALDAFALPSHQFEASGIGVLEAMAMGLPIVASRVGGVPESVIDNETGLLVEPGSVDDLASALIRLAGDSGVRRRMGERGRARVAERFTLEHEVAALAALYSEARGG